LQEAGTAPVEEESFVQMRASTRLKFVFICNPKCASTSIRNALDPHSNLRANPRSPRRPLSNHASAREVKAMFEEQGRDWSEYFSFTTMRNPWAKVASLYTYALKQPRSVAHEVAVQADDIAGFIGTDVFLETIRPLDRMTLDQDGARLVDRIYKVETLADDLPEIEGKLGVQLAVPHLNASSNHDYRQLFDARSVEKVRELFRSDIEAGQYEF
tara:strand:- start:13097 stop:13738 length:642 start_codon:yes stop_codon:yes gene_type:complete